MKWRYPISPATITGKQLLTRDRPITAIHRAIQEIQDAAVVKATVTINGEDLTAEVRGNVLRITGEIEAGSSSGGGDGLSDVDSDHAPYLTLVIEEDGLLRLSGEGFDAVYAPLVHEHDYASADHYHTNYALGGVDNPRELPAGANLNEVLTWSGSAWVAGPVRAL